MTNELLDYQKAKQRYHNAEIACEKAKALANAYAEELKKELESEGVSTVEELQEIYNKNLQELTLLTKSLESTAAEAEEILSKLPQGVA